MSGPYVESKWVLSLLSKNQTFYHHIQELHAILVQYPFYVGTLCSSSTELFAPWVDLVNLDFHACLVTPGRLLNNLSELSSRIPFFSEAFPLDSTASIPVQVLFVHILYILLYPLVCYSASSD